MSLHNSRLPSLKDQLDAEARALEAERAAAEKEEKREKKITKPKH